MRNFIFFFTAILFVMGISCNKEENNETLPEQSEQLISAVDISSLPEINSAQTKFNNSQGVEQNILELLKEKGINTIRLRLWVNPSSQHSGFEEVNAFSKELKSHDFQIWLTLHYSDIWADPGKRETPATWQNLSLKNLNDSVYAYTKKVIEKINPSIVQIGNEINSGILHPQGNISNLENLKQLLSSGIQAVREENQETRIMLHYAGTQHANWFFEQMMGLDYDCIGLSYYPMWHGKSLENLITNITQMGEQFNKNVFIAETAYPFSLLWNDYTNNILGLEEHLILPEFPTTVTGQANYVSSISEMVLTNESLNGFCYCGAEWVAWKGPESTSGSPWENQALFDFNNHAVSALNHFEINKP